MRVEVSEKRKTFANYEYAKEILTFLIFQIYEVKHLNEKFIETFRL